MDSKQTNNKASAYKINTELLVLLGFNVFEFWSDNIRVSRLINKPLSKNSEKFITDYSSGMRRLFDHEIAADTDR